MKREILYHVGIEHKETKEKINLEVWAENVDLATCEIRGLIGYKARYRWTGTNPLYENNNVICRYTESVNTDEN